ncbi:hypothetical protein GCM10009634_45080 [Saccharothrix xinjiangensis]
MRVGEENRYPGGGYLLVQGHLGSAVPGQKAFDQGRKVADSGDDRVGDGERVASAQRDEDQEVAGALDQGGHRAATALVDHQVAFPVTAHGSVIGLDQDAPATWSVTTAR